MKKIKYCKKCGERIIDGDFCPICGEKINNGVEDMKKRKHSRNIILILLVILSITILLLIGGAYVSKNNNKEFKTYSFSDTCTVDLPTWISFNDGAGDLNSNANIAGSSVSSTTKALLGNSEVMQITYSKSVVDGQAVGMDLNSAMNVNVGGKQVYTRTVMSEETGESVTVMGENQTLVNYIADHVKFNGKAGNNKTTDDSSQTNNNNNQKKAIAYKSDGTPMYSQSEVDKYVSSKYGSVNYRTQSNGYIALDDPSYTSDGHYIEEPHPDIGFTNGSYC